MIYVDRSRVPQPAFFHSAKVKSAQKEVADFFARPKQARVQERFDFARQAAKIDLKILRPALYALFHRKCVYCETPIGTSSSGDIELFRPRVAPSELIPRGPSRAPKRSKGWLSLAKSEEDRDGYWWLAYDWQNFYIACEICNRHKRNQFPVVGRRALPGTRGKKLRAERALLLDPCVDRPEEYLVFGDQGEIVSRKPRDRDELKSFGGCDRGAVTIDILALNREALRAERQRQAKDLRLHWMGALSGSSSQKIKAEINALVDPAQPYCGMKRQLVTRWIQSLYKDSTPDLRTGLMTELAQFAPELATKRKKRLPLPVRLRRMEISAKKPRLKKTLKVQKQHTIGFMRSFRIRNFKAIRDLTIELQVGEENRIGWKVLLGENGTGKSSILQAVALTLMGPAYLRRYLREFRLRPADLLRKVRGGRTVSSADILVEFSTGQKCSLKISSKRMGFVFDPPEGIFVRGYGATRLLPRRNAARMRVRKGLRTNVANLFDPAHPVFNADGWLAGISGRKQFGSAALALKDLLGLPGFSKVRVSSGKVVVPMNGLIHSLDELSAGYESILAMATDIIAANLEQHPDLRLAPGIVLLDEIDAHLHPRWKMQIVDSLRRTFSSMQFLVTTHEPLCLRGIEKGEVAVLERNGKDITILEDLPAPSSLRVDQLLTSNFFGLGSTIDPALEKEFNRYYELLARPVSRLTRAEKTECERLRNKLAKYEYRLMADSPRQELLYQALDEYVAKDVSVRGEARDKLPELRAKTAQRVADLWKNYQVSGGSVRDLR